MNRILVIEDEIKLADMLKKAFEHEGFLVDVANDGYTGKKKALEKKHDIIILDILLPMLNGYDVCRDIRAEHIQTPIIMLTAIGSIENKLLGFKAGADDYISKPFEFKELLARVIVFLKRTNALGDQDIIFKLNDLILNNTQRTVTRAGKPVKLTKKEFDILEMLLRHKDNIVTRAEIVKEVWDISFNTGTNMVEVYINYLRRKIDKDHPVKLIHTMVGLGYVMREGEQ
jgi:two-component system, OmpR family, copper resistance phosphate regulon response regulator CusR